MSEPYRLGDAYNAYTKEWTWEDLARIIIQCKVRAEREKFAIQMKQQLGELTEGDVLDGRYWQGRADLARTLTAYFGELQFDRHDYEREERTWQEAEEQE